MQETDYRFDDIKKARKAQRHLDRMIAVQEKDDYPDYLRIDYDFAKFDDQNILLKVFLPDPEDLGQVKVPFAIVVRENDDSRGHTRNTVHILDYMNESNEDQKALLRKRDIRKEPCAVCGQVLKNRRTMFVSSDNESGELEYYGKECVRKEFPEISLEIIDKYMKNLQSLNLELENNSVKISPDDVNIEDFIEECLKIYKKEHFGPLIFMDVFDHFESKSNDYNDNVKARKIAFDTSEKLFNLDYFVKEVKKNRELPGTDLYNLRELLGAKTFTENRVNEIKPYVEGSIEAIKDKLSKSLQKEFDGILEKQKVKYVKHDTEHQKDKKIDYELINADKDVRDIASKEKDFMYKLGKEVNVRDEKSYVTSAMRFLSVTKTISKKGIPYIKIELGGKKNKEIVILNTSERDKRHINFYSRKTIIHLLGKDHDYDITRVAGQLSNYVGNIVTYVVYVGVSKNDSKQVILPYKGKVREVTSRIR